MKLTIDTATVLRKPENGGFYYRGVVIQTLDDGHQVRIAVRTKTNSLEPSQVMQDKGGNWQSIGFGDFFEHDHDPVGHQVAKVFTAFLTLMQGRFVDVGDGTAKPVFNDALLNSNAQTAVNGITTFTAIIGGRFVEQQGIRYFEAPLTQPTEWQNLQPTQADRMAIEKLIGGLNRQLGQRQAKAYVQRTYGWEKTA